MTQVPLSAAFSYGVARNDSEPSPRLRFDRVDHPRSIKALIFLECMSPEVARSGHALRCNHLSASGEKRTCRSVEPRPSATRLTHLRHSPNNFVAMHNGMPAC